MAELAPNFPLITILLAFLSAALSLCLPQRVDRVISIVSLSLTVAMSGCVLWRGLVTGEHYTYTVGKFPAPWGNELSFGILEPFLAMMLSAAILMCLVGGVRTLESHAEPRKLHLYYGMANMVCAGVLALCYTNDIFTAYVFMEIGTLASCGILVVKENGKILVASMRYLIFNLVGSGLFLLGVILLYGITGHLLLPQLKESVAAIWASGAYSQPLSMVVTLIASGLALKSGLFPFHIWVIDAHSGTVAGSSGILSGVVFKAHIILLIKLIYQVFGTEMFYACGAANVLLIYGILGMMAGSIEAIRERDFKRMVAASSISQIGYIFMGIGTSPELGVAAACAHILAHACAKPGMFLSCTRLAEGTGTMKLSAQRGAGRRDPVAGICFAVNALSLVGFPGLMGFVSKIVLAQAGVMAGGWRMPAVLIALTVSAVLNGVYLVRTGIQLFLPVQEPVPSEPAPRCDMPFAISAVFFSGASLFFGFFFQTALDLIQTGLALL